MKRTLVPSGSPYASIVVFSRAVRVGNVVSIGGTEPIDADGATVGVGDPAEMDNVWRRFGSLEQAGASLQDVARTRMLLTRTDDWQNVAKVRGEYFQDIRPVDTAMEVSCFINPDWLIEMDVDAIIGDK